MNVSDHCCPLYVYIYITEKCVLDFSILYFHTDMIIGFTERIQRVSESNTKKGEDFFPIYIPVATLRLSERVHPIVFCLQSGSTAIVEQRDYQSNPILDAVFGSRAEPNAPLKVQFDLQSLVAVIPPLLAEIRNDLITEEEECFTIRIFPVNVQGRRELFSCNEDDSGATNLHCETTICIEDDDGTLTSL